MQGFCFEYDCPILSFIGLKNNNEQNQIHVIVHCISNCRTFVCKMEEASYIVDLQ